MDYASIALIAALVLAALCGRMQIGPGTWRGLLPGPLTLLVAALTALGLAVQLVVPGTLELLRRDTAAIGNGEAWRLLTTLFFQDGGLPGGLFNIAALLVIGTLAERIWRPWQWLVLYFGGGFVAQVVGLSWQPIGAGNSVAWMSLGASLLILGVMVGPTAAATIAGILGLAAGFVLIALGDIHGAAVAIGAIGGLLLHRVRAARISTPVSRR